MAIAFGTINKLYHSTDGYDSLKKIPCFFPFLRGIIEANAIFIWIYNFILFVTFVPAFPDAKDVLKSNELNLNSRGDNLRILNLVSASSMKQFSDKLI